METISVVAWSQEWGDIDSKGVQGSSRDDGNVLYPGCGDNGYMGIYICQVNSLTCLYLKYNV